MNSNVDRKTNWFDQNEHLKYKMITTIEVKFFRFRFNMHIIRTISQDRKNENKIRKMSSKM